MALVEQAAHAPADRFWHRGELVKGNPSLPIGTVIATFDPGGTYGNHTDHTSHAAIYLGQDAFGIMVMDQWINHRNGKRDLPQPAHKRTLPFNNIHDHVVNNGDHYFVVE